MRIYQIEKVVYNQLIEFIVNNSILIEYQSGIWTAMKECSSVCATIMEGKYGLWWNGWCGVFRLIKKLGLNG